VNALIFAVAVLFVAVLVLSICFVALARQVGVLFERIAPMGALMTDSGPKVGEPTPRLRLESLTGGEIEIGSESARSTLVFFLSPACPVCKKLLPVLHAIRSDERDWLDVVLASDGERASHDRLIEKAGLQSFPYLLSAQLGLSYRVARLPFAVLIDRAGVIRAKGLVNNREQLESLFNAQDMQTASIQQYLGKLPNETRIRGGDHL
jgi:methylamine dehydrogenase accessory protein MauD